VASLDIAVSSAIMRLHALERALHDDGPWEMEFMGVRVPANRFVFNDRVQFCALFRIPMTHELRDGCDSIWLRCGGDAVISRPTPELPVGKDFILDWVMELDPRVLNVVSA
jgi:hypothetical protein